MRKLLWVALTALYPLLVFLGLSHAQPRALALVLLLLGLMRWATAGGSRQAQAVAFAGLGLAAVTALSNHSLPLKLYPVAINAALLLLFGLSLWRGPSVVERLARLHEPELDASGVAYTRRVTQVWCGFFIVNGALALATSLWASERVWAVYNGLIAYVLIGLLMAGEWCVRRRVRARKEQAHVA